MTIVPLVQQGFFDSVCAVSDREIRMLTRLTYLVTGADLETALELVAYKSNHKYLAAALARIYHFYECLPSDELKAKGYEKLREIVTNIACGLWNIDAHLNQNPAYQRVAAILFTNQGFKSP